MSCATRVAPDIITLMETPAEKTLVFLAPLKREVGVQDILVRPQLSSISVWVSVPSNLVMHTKLITKLRLDVVYESTRYGLV